MSHFVPFALPIPDPPVAGARVAFVLHGILGNHTNWRSVARRLQEALPGWQLHLVDHRSHGQSGPAPGPQTLEACGKDLAALAARTGAPEVVLGHSFGGKVALAYAATRPAGLRAVFVLDATPAAIAGEPGGDDDVRRVLAALRDVPLPLPQRGDVVEALTARGLSESIGRWMTTNLRRVDGGFVWTFDVDRAQELLRDYFAQDLWAPLETEEPGAPRIHLVRAGRSDRWSPEIVARLDALHGAQAGRAHLLPDAGHWLHVDDPDGLLALLTRLWPSPAGEASPSELLG